MSSFKVVSECDPRAAGMWSLADGKGTTGAACSSATTTDGGVVSERLAGGEQGCSNWKDICIRSPTKSCKRYELSTHNTCASACSKESGCTGF